MRLKKFNTFNPFATFSILAFGALFLPVNLNAAPPALVVSGTSILRSDTSCAVTLRGVNVPSLEWGVGEGPPSGIGGDIVASVTYAIDTMKANIVRIPLNEGRWLEWTYSYTQTVDNIVAACSVRNAYVILDLHLLTAYASGGGSPVQQSMPDANSTAFWAQVSARYKNNPAVLFGIYNEPFPPDWNTWGTTGSGGGPTIPALLSTVRSGGATNICLIGGLQYSYQLTGMPALTDSTGNYVFDEHIYPPKGATSAWDTNIGSPGKPVFVGEFGQLTGDGTWDSGTFLPWLATKNYGATAWGFNANATLNYAMLTGYFTFNTWHGIPVQTWLAGAPAGCNPAEPNPIPTPVPTATPVAGSCFMLDDLEDGDIINATNGSWFTFRWTSVNGAAVLPWAATESCPDGTPCPYILDNTQSYPAGTTFSARVTGAWTNNGPTTYAGFALGTELEPGYTNLGSWVTLISFDVRATAAVTLRCNAVNPLISYSPVVYQGVTLAGSGGGNDNQYGFNFVVAQPNTWMHVTRTKNAFECGDWGYNLCPPPVPRTSTTNFMTQAQAMTQILSLQWETQGAPSTVGFWIDNVCLSGTTIPPTATPSAVAFTATFTRTNTPTVSPTNSPTNTPTKTPTNTATSTFTNTATYTMTNSPTKTPTLTATNSPTPTATNSPTSTSTNSPTNTPVNTATNSATSTPSNTPLYTSTSTSTATNSATKTSTNTPTNSPTNTATSSPTNSSTLSFTPTSTLTFSPTSTASATFTSTNTSTRTSTNSPTDTPTNSPTKTPTNTPTDTFTDTPTDSPTITGTPTNSPTGTLQPTNTPTNTNSPTNSPTKTFTSTSTNTPTSTPSNTPTSTATSTPTLTLTNTRTTTATNTPTSTVTNTATSTNTGVFTNTPTNTSTKTLSPTATSTNTITPTPIATATATATTVTVVVASGPSIPPSSTQLPGAINVPVVQILVTNTGNTPVTLTSLTITDSGTGNAQAGITGIALTNNGTFLGASTFTGSTATFGTISVVIPVSGSVTLQANSAFSNTAPAGTYQFSVTGSAGTNGQAVNFNGLPYNGATITIASATATSTPIFTNTATPSLTSTSTPGPKATPTLVIFPNPSNGTQTISVLVATTAASDIKAQIFTTAFRKVQEESFAKQPVGTPVTLNPTDQWGTPLASGLYYVVVTVNGSHRLVGKLLIIR